MLDITRAEDNAASNFVSKRLYGSIQRDVSMIVFAGFYFNDVYLTIVRIDDIQFLAAFLVVIMQWYRFGRQCACNLILHQRAFVNTNITGHHLQLHVSQQHTAHQSRIDKV